MKFFLLVSLAIGFFVTNYLHGAQSVQAYRIPVFARMLGKAQVALSKPEQTVTVTKNKAHLHVITIVGIAAIVLSVLWCIHQRRRNPEVLYVIDIPSDDEYSQFRRRHPIPHREPHQIQQVLPAPQQQLPAHHPEHHGALYTISPDDTKLFSYLLQAAHAGDIAELLILANLFVNGQAFVYQNRDLIPTLDARVGLIRERALQKEVLLKLCYCYSHGIGVKKNEHRAQEIKRALNNLHLQSAPQTEQDLRTLKQENFGYVLHALFDCSEKACPICTDDFASDIDIELLPCWHAMHLKCGLASVFDLNNPTPCPLCRAETTTSIAVRTW